MPKKATRSITDWLKTKNGYRRLPCSQMFVRLIRRQQAWIRRRPPERTKEQLAGLPLLWGENTEGTAQSCAGGHRATVKDVGSMGRE